MTYTIPPDSPKALKARAFGRELVKACRARDVPLKGLARSIGIGHTALDHYRQGVVLPKTATAYAIAEVLDWPRLAEIVEQARTFVCGRPGCERTYRHEGGGPRRYCTPDCQRIAVAQRKGSRRLHQAGQKDDGRLRAAAIAQLRSAARIADERAVAAEISIAAYCRGCEPEGLCRTADCPLRPFSPLPLATRDGHYERPRTNAEIRVEINRKAAPARRAVMTRLWADPDWREKQVALSQAGQARMTPEQLAARGRAISAAKAARTPERRAAEHRKAGETRRRDRAARTAGIGA